MRAALGCRGENQKLYSTTVIHLAAHIKLVSFPRRAPVGRSHAIKAAPDEADSERGYNFFSPLPAFGARGLLNRSPPPRTKQEPKHTHNFIYWFKR